MTEVNNKWYKSWWIYVVVFFITIVLLILGLKKTKAYMNYQEYLKTEIEDLKRINLKKDQTIDSLILVKQKIKIIRERISTEEQDKVIRDLEQELTLLRKEKSELTPTIKQDTIYPIHKLTRFLEDLLKEN